MPLPTTGVGPTAAPPNFSTSIVGYWRLDEASGSRADSSGNGNTLTDNNTVLSGTGKVSATAADFESTNTEWLSRADQASFEIGTSSWSCLGWINLESAASGNRMMILSKFGWGGLIRGYYLAVDNAAQQLYCITTDATNPALLQHSASLSTATWYFVAAGYDASVKKCWISLNGATREQGSAAGTAPTVQDDTFTFRLGHVSGGGASQYFDGLMEQWGFWVGRVLTDAEITYAYNGGNGRQLF